MSDIRTWMLVHEDGEKNTYVITWPPGSGLKQHGHGASAVSILVSDGELYEETDTPDEDGETDNYLMPGLLYTRAVGVRHSVRNLSSEGAVSIHTYSPPLTLEYDEDLEIVPDF